MSEPRKRARPVMRLDDALLQLMEEAGQTKVDIGDYGLLDEAYALAYAGKDGSRCPHPMNRHRAIMDAVRRSPKFERIGSIRHHYPGGRCGERLHPFYKIRTTP